MRPKQPALPFCLAAGRLTHSAAGLQRFPSPHDAAKRDPRRRGLTSRHSETPRVRPAMQAG